MNIIANFTNNGIPATGLTPTIRIRDLNDNSLVITDVGMSEVGDGVYKYDFVAYDDTKDYSIRCDGGNTLNNYERYTFGTNEVGGLAEQSDIELIKTEVDKIEFCKQMLSGYKRKIINNQEIFYNDNGIEIARFNLYDNNGNPTMSSVFERRKV